MGTEISLVWVAVKGMVFEWSEDSRGSSQIKKRKSLSCECYERLTRTKHSSRLGSSFSFVQDERIEGPASIVDFSSLGAGAGAVISSVSVAGY